MWLEFESAVRFYDIDNIVLITKQSKLISVVESTNIRTCSRKTKKLRSIHTIGRGLRIISIKNVKLTI